MTLPELLQYSVTYYFKFGVHLETRVRELIERYPDVSAPNFISWEGEQETKADTTEALRQLLADLRASFLLAIQEVPTNA